MRIIRPSEGDMAERMQQAAGIDEIWRDVAQRATDGQLALLAALVIPVAVGSAVAALLKVGIVRWWPLLLVPLFLSAFGFWGIADREIHSPATHRPRGVMSAWSLLRAVATALAVACAVVATLLFLRVTVGTWIS